MATTSLLMDEDLETKGLTIAETVQDGQAVMEGWLVKRGSAVHSLKKRWFIASRGALQYFEDKLANKDDAHLLLQKKGVFPLANATVTYTREAYLRWVMRQEPEQEKKKTGALSGMMNALNISKSEDVDPSLSFVVRSVGKVMVLYAATHEELDSWMRAISKYFVIYMELTEYPNPSKEGWLYKTSATDPEQKLRYLQLFHNRLAYYEDSADASVKTSVDLINTRIGLVAGREDKLTRMFIVVKEGLWYFEAPNVTRLRTGWTQSSRTARTRPICAERARRLPHQDGTPD